MSCHDCGSPTVKAGLCQNCLTNLQYCGKCNQRRYFRNGKCEMCTGIMPTTLKRLKELMGKMEIVTTDGDLSILIGDDIGDIYSWLEWAVNKNGGDA